MNEKMQQMGEFLNNAKAVMDRVNQIAPKEPSKGQPTLSESVRMENVGQFGYDELSSYPSYEQPQNSYNKNTYSEASKKLPQSILESITQNPISDYQGQGGLSVLDSIIPKQQSQLRGQITEANEYGEKEMPTTEELYGARVSSTNHQQQPVYQQQPAYQQQPSIGSPIDYSLINSMIKTAISEEMQKLKKYMITENKQSSNDGDVSIKVGNGSKFITNNGNVYEGKVKVVGNLK